MNPVLVAEIAAKNGSDLEAIVNKVGFTTLLQLLPHLMNILQTVQELQNKPA